MSEICVNIQLCTKCKRVQELNEDNFYKSEKRPSGFSTMCKTCYRHKYRSKKIKVPDRVKFNNYKTRDLKRGQVFNIDMEFFQEQLTKPCKYCTFPSTGLDRIDNSIGHTKDNCVPCCKECNMARMDNFTQEEMMIIGRAIKYVKELRLGKN